jgi:hypothetical protein
MSRVASSFQQNAPGSLTIAAPTWVRACHTENTAPLSSANTAMRPVPSTSSGSITTRPPASRTFSVAASASSVLTYVVHIAG